MAIFQKDLERIDFLNQFYNKTLKAELLQFLDLTKDYNYTGLDIDFEIKNNLIGQYNKSISYLNLINNNHISFFENNIRNLSDKSKKIVNSNEKLLFEINNEFNLLKQKKDTDSSLKNIDIANIFFNENQFNETSDFMNGYFLFNKKLYSSIENNDEDINNEKFKKFPLLFDYFNNLKDKFINESIFFFPDFNAPKIFKRILNTHQLTEDLSTNNISGKINQISKNYLSHTISLDDNFKITNFKKYPISTSGLSQSIYNIISGQDYYSNNTLFYGIIPFATINHFRKLFDKTLLTEITDVSIFQKDTMNEYLPFKFINREDILICEEKNAFVELVKEIEKELYQNINSDNDILLHNFEKSDILKLNPLNYKSLFINNDFFNIDRLINPSKEVIHSIGNNSLNLILIDKNTKLDLDTNLNQNRHNKFKVFKNKIINTNFSQVNFDDINSLNMNIHITDDDSLKYKETPIKYLDDIHKDSSKKVGLNLLKLIASKIQTDNLTVLSTSTNYTINNLYNLPGPTINDITKNNENANTPLDTSSSVSIRAISNQRRGALPASLNLNNNIRNINEFDNKNINNNIITQNANFSEILQYTKKSKLIQNTKGLSNISFFNEENNFALSIIKNRYLINDVCIKSKKIIKGNISQFLKNQNSFLKEISDNNNLIHYRSLDFSKVKSNLFNKINNKNLNNFSLNTSQNRKNIYRDNITIEDSLGFLSNSDYQLKKELIVKNNNYIANDSLLNITNTNLTNLNHELLNIDKVITQTDITNIYENTITDDIIYKIKDQYSNNLLHFSNNNSLFEYIKNYCKNYINKNLNENDHLNNFKNRANIVETASLLWSISSSCKNISSENKFNLKKNLIDSLLFEFILKNDNRKNTNENIKSSNDIKKLIINDITPDVISDISGFYVWSNKLKNIDIKNLSQYNPYDNSEHLEQDGLFYHFLFSNLHQKMYFKNTKNGIQKYNNDFDPHEYLKSILCFYMTSDEFNNNNVFFKNILNSGFFDYFDESNEYENVFLPYIEYSTYEEKPCFIVSLKTNDISKLNSLKDKIKIKLRSIKIDESQQIKFSRFFKNIDYIIENIDDIITDKNILNIAIIENSFLNNNDSNSFLQNLIIEMLNFPEFKNKFNNISSLSQLQSTDIEDIKIIKNIIDSTLLICSDIFNKMFIEIQSYNSLVMRIFDSNFYFQHNKNILKNLGRINYNDSLNTRNVSEYILNDEYKTLIGENNLERIMNYYNYLDNSFNQKFEKSELDLHKLNNTLKPSEKKFINTLSSILGISKEDILKIYTYMSIKPELNSKNINIFEYFNTHTLPLSKIIKNKKESDGIFDLNRDCSTFIYDYMHEVDGIYNNNLYVNIPYKDNEYPSQSDIASVEKFSGEYYSLISNIMERIDGNRNICDRDKSNEIETLQFNSIINLKDIFNYIIAPSYETREKYHNIEVYNQSTKEINQNSGCKNLSEDDLNYLIDIEDLNVIKPINSGVMTYKDIFIKNYSLNLRNIEFENIFDINNNWYNHISRGLILNDFTNILNSEFVIYYNNYKNGIGLDTYEIYQYLNEIRTNNKNYSNDNSLTTYNSKDYLKQNTTLNNFILTKNNIDLKRSYIKNTFDGKKIKNLIDIYDKKNKDINETLKYLISNNDILLTNFKDYYLNNFVNNQQSLYTSNAPQIDNTNKYLLLNQNLKLNDCHILTIGVEEKDFKNNNMIIVNVEMIDHDFPLIQWESKQFEFDLSIDDAFNEVFQKNEIFKTTGDAVKNTITNNADISLPLLSYEKINLENNNIEKLINQNNSPADLYSNNISLKNTILNDLDLNINLDFQKLLQNRVNVFKNQFNKIKMMNEIDDNIFLNVITDMTRRAIYNQKKSMHLKHIIKLLTGNEFNVEFSLKENKDLQEILVLNEVYELYTSTIFSNLNSSTENELGFTYEELEQAFSIAGDINFDKNYELNGFSFKIGNITSNHNLNIFIKFMADFSRLLIPSFDTMSNKNFRKIMNIAISPSDFIASSISNQLNIYNNLPEDYSNITFKLIENGILDESLTYYKQLNQLILEKNNIDINYYEVLFNNQKYIPKNISYRIKVDLLD